MIDTPFKKFLRITLALFGALAICVLITGWAHLLVEPAFKNVGYALLLFPVGVIGIFLLDQSRRI